MTYVMICVSGLGFLAGFTALFLAVNGLKRAAAERNSMRERYQSKLERLSDMVEKLQSGIIPDYEEAKAAANAVNDFSKGISNILGFDPMTALKAEQERKKRGED